MTGQKAVIDEVARLDKAVENQQLHVTWKHACPVQPCDLSDRVNNLNFTITLDANTQQVVLTYGAQMDGTMVAGAMDRAKGATSTVGLANDTTGCPVEECVFATGLCKDGVTHAATRRCSRTPSSLLGSRTSSSLRSSDRSDATPRLRLPRSRELSSVRPLRARRRADAA